MKILHLTTHLDIGGITSYIRMTARAMRQKGHDVAVLSSGGALTETLRSEGVRSFELPIRTKNEFHPKLYFQLPAMIRLVRAEGFEVLHAHTRVTQVLGSAVSALAGVPLVTTAHGFFKPNPGRRFFGAWGRRVVAISPLVADDLEKSHGVNKEKIRVVLNGIDAVDFQKKLSEKNAASVRRDYGIMENAVVLSSVSRLVKDKGHEHLLRAVKLLKDAKKNVFLLILGDGREKEALKKLADSLGLQGSVRILDAEKDVTRVFSMTDIFVHPATWREGFGLSIAEAMIAGKPVIVTDIPALNTIVENGATGLVVRPADARALAEAVGRLIEDPARAVAIAEEGRRMALGRSSLERMTDGLLAVYKEATGK